MKGRPYKAVIAEVLLQATPIQQSQWTSERCRYAAQGTPSTGFFEDFARVHEPRMESGMTMICFAYEVTTWGQSKAVYGSKAVRSARLVNTDKPSPV